MRVCKDFQGLYSLSKSYDVILWASLPSIKFDMSDSHAFKNGMTRKILLFLFVPFLLGVNFHTVKPSLIMQVVINEVYYDSPGYDEHTFTELKGPAGAFLDSMYLIWSERPQR